MMTAPGFRIDRCGRSSQRPSRSKQEGCFAAAFLRCSEEGLERRPESRPQSEHGLPLAISQSLAATVSIAAKLDAARATPEDGWAVVEARHRSASPSRAPVVQVGRSPPVLRQRLARWRASPARTAVVHGQGEGAMAGFLIERAAVRALAEPDRHAIHSRLDPGVRPLLDTASLATRSPRTLLASCRPSRSCKRHMRRPCFRPSRGRPWRAGCSGPRSSRGRSSKSSGGWLVRGSARGACGKRESIPVRLCGLRPCGGAGTLSCRWDSESRRRRVWRTACLGCRGRRASERSGDVRRAAYRGESNAPQRYRRKFAIDIEIHLLALVVRAPKLADYIAAASQTDNKRLAAREARMHHSALALHPAEIPKVESN